MNKKQINLIQEALMAYGDDTEIIEVLTQLNTLKKKPFGANNKAKPN